MPNKRTILISTAVLMTAAGLGAAVFGFLKWDLSVLMLAPVAGTPLAAACLIILYLLPAGRTKTGDVVAFSLITLVFLLVLIPLGIQSARSAPTDPALLPGPGSGSTTPNVTDAALTPEPIPAVSLQDPADFPDWLADYWRSDQWPDETTQIGNSARMLELYRALLLDRGIAVEGWSDYEVFYQAARLANTEDWTLPADLVLTRSMYAGPQGARYEIPTYVDPAGGSEYGILRHIELGRFLRIREDDETISMAQTSGNMVTNTFGVDVLLQRQLPYMEAWAPEGVLVEIKENQFVLILRYPNIDLSSNQRQDYYLPLSVRFVETDVAEVIRKTAGSEQFSVQSIETYTIWPSLCGYSCPWNEETLRSALVIESAVSVYGGGGSMLWGMGIETEKWFPIVGGLEYAVMIRFDHYFVPYPPPTRQ